MTLTVPEIKNAKPKDRDYKLYDEKGLYVLVTTKASKYWRLKYRFGGKEKVFSIGVFPEVSLKEARDIRDKTRVTIVDGCYGCCWFCLYLRLCSGQLNPDTFFDSNS
jgi:hypothetical protein